MHNVAMLRFTGKDSRVSSERSDVSTELDEFDARETLSPLHPTTSQSVIRENDSMASLHELLC
jgi:hypothetical protein